MTAALVLSGPINIDPTKAVDLQDAYDAAPTGPQILLQNGNPFEVQLASGTGDVFAVIDSASDDVFRVADDTLEVGDTGTNGQPFTVAGINNSPAQGRPELHVLTGTITYGSTPTPGIISVDGTLVNTELGGSQTFGGVINATAVYTQRSAGFGFNNGLIFNHAVTYRNESGFAANFGSFFTLVDQPLIQADGSVRTGIIHNSVRAQPRFGTINGGTLNWSSVTLYETAGTVSAGATVTTWRCFRAGGLATGGGAITTWIGFDLVQPTAIAPGTVIGFRTDAGFDSPRTFIQHQGTAVSTFAGDIHFNNTVAAVFGSTGVNRVELFRPAAGTLRMIGVGGTQNEGLDWDFDPSAANYVNVSSSTGAGLDLAFNKVIVGADLGFDPTTANWNILLNPGATTVTVGGDFARTLFSASANITVDAAVSNLATFTINEPGVTIGTGSVVNGANVIIQTSVSFGTNRYGLLVTSNPSGGTLNYCARFQGAAGVRIDGVFEHTGSTFGALGATPAAQQSVTALTDSTGGTANDTLVAISGSGDDANINNNFADLAAKVNALRGIFNTFGYNA